MAKRINAIWNFLSHYKYLIVIVIGISIVGFLDDNSFLKHMPYDMQISDLKAEISKYNARHAEDSVRLHELKQNPKAIEKIARERYFMKADDEDIFVFDNMEKTDK